MKAQRLAAALAAINLVLLVLILARGFPSPAVAAAASIEDASPSRQPTAVPILRGRVLELVDDQGQIRSRLNVEPNGEVVFRLLDQKGRIRVKLSAGEGGSGLLLLDETTEPAVQIIARRTGNAATPKTTSVTLSGSGGQQRVLTP